jgi:hypothetical protein
MPNLEVLGATLYYETFGSGPLLLLIPGADGRGSIFHEVAAHLSADFAVACWDHEAIPKATSKALKTSLVGFPQTQTMHSV